MIAETQKPREPTPPEEEDFDELIISSLVPGDAAGMLAPYLADQLASQSTLTQELTEQNEEDDIPTRLLPLYWQNSIVWQRIHGELYFGQRKDRNDVPRPFGGLAVFGVRGRGWEQPRAAMWIRKGDEQVREVKLPGDKSWGECNLIGSGRNKFYLAHWTTEDGTPIENYSYSNPRKARESIIMKKRELRDSIHTSNIYGRPPYLQIIEVDIDTSYATHVDLGPALTPLCQLGTSTLLQRTSRYMGGIVSMPNTEIIVYSLGLRRQKKVLPALCTFDSLEPIISPSDRQTKLPDGKSQYQLATRSAQNTFYSNLQNTENNISLFIFKHPQYEFPVSVERIDVSNPLVIVYGYLVVVEYDNSRVNYMGAFGFQFGNGVNSACALYMHNEGRLFKLPSLTIPSRLNNVTTELTPHDPQYRAKYTFYYQFSPQEHGFWKAVLRL